MVYRYRATLTGSKTFMREYDFISNMKLFKLYDFLQNDLGFAPDQIAIFQGVDKNGVTCSEYGLFDMGDGSMDSVTLEKTYSKGEIALRYIYDLNKNKYILLTFVEEAEFANRESYPRVISEKGRNPNQFSDKYEDYGEFDDSEIAPSPDEELYEADELPEGEE